MQSLQVLLFLSGSLVLAFGAQFLGVFDRTFEAIFLLGVLFLALVDLMLGVRVALLHLDELG